MSRSRRSVSRSLIVILVIVLSIGTFAVLHRSSGTKAAEHAAAPTPAPVVIASAEQPGGSTVVDPPKTVPEVIPTVTPTTVTPPEVVPVPMAVVPPATRPVERVSGNVSQPTPIGSDQPTAAAKGKLDAGDFVGARKILNDALNAPGTSAAEASAIKLQMSDVSKTLTFSNRRFDDDVFAGSYVIKPGDKLAKIATGYDVTWELLARVNNVDPKKIQSGRSIKIIKGPFHAVVNKGAFSMDIYLGSPGEKGSVYVTTFPVGLGKDNSTPTGTWQVPPHGKIVHPKYYSPRGEGVFEASDPKNPLGGFWIAIEGIDGKAVGAQSYGIHGTIDPDSIGKMSSMGCIRLRHDDIALVFDLMVEGKSTVIVKE